MKKIIRKIIQECLEEIFSEGEDFMMDEMACPESFNFEEFKNIRSFAGKQRYAKQHLLGKVGAGSARAVFKIDDEKVIKIALNNKGIAQNISEAEGYKQNYDVVARVFETDENDMWIEMELAKKITLRRFKELTGTSPEEIGRWLASERGEKTWGTVTDLEDNEFAEEMSDFTGDYQYPVPGDFTKISTYGEVLRDGVPKVVVIDFGFDISVKDVYDTARKEKVQAYNRRRAYAY